MNNLRLDELIDENILFFGDDIAEDDGAEDRRHAGGFRLYDKITLLEGNVSDIVRAIAPVANTAIYNPNAPAPKAPQPSYNLTMAPSAPAMGGGMAAPAPRAPFYAQHKLATNNNKGSGSKDK